MDQLENRLDSQTGGRGKHKEELRLVRKAKAGDTKSYSALYAQIYIELYKFALYTLRHPQDAEDAVSEAVTAAYENITKLKSETSFRNWMFTILANQCRKRFIKREKDEELTEDIAQPEIDYGQKADVRAALETLSEEERLIVSFSVFGGYKSAEIGGMLGIEAATVRSKKNRALGKMRKILE